MAFNKPIKPANDIEAVKRSAFWHLSRRDHSEQELRSKLSRKTDNQQWIDAVIDECYSYRYLDDDRFTESFIRSAQNKGYGINRIQRDLQQKGISQQQASHHFQASQFDYIDSATQLLDKRYRQRIENAHLKQKVMAFLQNKGHTFEHIFSAIECHNEAYPIEDYDALGDALKLLNGKFREPISDKKQQDKALRFLVSRGYSYQDCQKAITQYNIQLSEQDS
ncbi:transcriptional regulator [Psychromonas sp. psych-6C06]|uniref:regulatory protein RecX n=1 Tax=Psychromonas sp. psych-6C06 TaxID=2058089 RepID=UPI000C33950F|nr:regulatory protein RecX [Psychromonas sp. psych-6C06]PKF60380.1 transcriptional regulator [Psychromonas sp. psych-6C06]